MATIKLIVLLAGCLAVSGIPQTPPRPTSTIFGDERLSGEIFENIDAFSSDVSLSRSDANAYRLPTTTKPTHYNVLWTIDISRLVFTGSVEINFVATQANLNEIVIHSNELEITSLSVRQGTTTLPSSYTLEPQYHFLRVRLNNAALQYSPTNPIIYTMVIEFGAPLRTDMTGIYRSWFRNNSTDPVR